MKTELNSIVVGIAQPGAEDPALGAALRIARRAGATLHVVYAYPPPQMLSDDAWLQFQHRWTHGEGHRIQDMVRAEVARTGDYHKVTVSAIPGPAAQVICSLAVSRGADLIVVGATRHGRISRTLLGSTAHRVLRSAPAPVLLVRGEVDRPVSRVLLTTDLSPLSGRVHRRACELLPLMLDAPPELQSLFVTGYDVEMSAAVPDLLHAAREEFDQFMAENAPDAATPRIRLGLPAHEILEEADRWGADLVVMGTHSRRGLARLFLGSVAEWVLQRAPCSVLVLPARAPHNAVAEPLALEAAALETAAAG